MHENINGCFYVLLGGYRRSERLIERRWIAAHGAPSQEEVTEDARDDAACQTWIDSLPWGHKDGELFEVHASTLPKRALERYCTTLALFISIAFRNYVLDYQGRCYVLLKGHDLTSFY